jgi:hypothetical protein
VPTLCLTWSDSGTCPQHLLGLWLTLELTLMASFFGINCTLEGQIGPADGAGSEQALAPCVWQLLSPKTGRVFQSLVANSHWVCSASLGKPGISHGLALHTGQTWSLRSHFFSVNDHSWSGAWGLLF